VERRWPAIRAADPLTKRLGLDRKVQPFLHLPIADGLRSRPAIEGDTFMAMTTDPRAMKGADPRLTGPKPAEPSFFHRKEVRSAIYQILLVVALIAFFYVIINNTATNLRQRNIASGYSFLGSTAGFDISQTLIDYANTSSYGRAFLVGLWNTILVAAIGIFFATIVGFVAGIARLSSNWLIAKIATWYVEILRNVPLLLQLFLWYFGVLKALPAPRQSVNFGDLAFLNVRGLYTPKPEWLVGSGVFFGSILFGIVASMFVAHWANKRQMATGQRFPVLRASLGLIILLPTVMFFVLGQPVQFDVPKLQGFNFVGGNVLQPEMVALILGLVFYTASYIAEIVRAGILGVSKGQKEAARAIGLTTGQTLRLVVIPQAARIIIPPLTSNYLNLTKNSSLAVAIAYPDLVNVAGTILNQTGQAVEVILMIMGVYLTLSLLTSAFMNWFNAKMALVER
jgi:general L-amino acid transport system permease protein